MSYLVKPGQGQIWSPRELSLVCRCSAQNHACYSLHLVKTTFLLSRTQRCACRSLYQPFNLCQFLKNEQISTPMSHRSRLAAFKSPSAAARELRLNGMKSQDLWPLQHLWFMARRHRKRLFSISPLIKLFHWVLVTFCLGIVQNKHLNLQQHIE